MTTLDELYTRYEELNSAENKAEHKDAYVTVLNGAKGGVNEKRLASQLIARFFKHFPELHEIALNALLDLCEDADATIRKQAVRDLPTICRECPDYTQRIADILTQLLQVEDAVELRLVEQSLMDLARRDARNTFNGILNQLDLTVDDALRTHAARFLGARIKELSDSGVLSGGAQSGASDCETYLADRINELMRKRKASLGGDEFVSLMTALSALRTMQTVNGRAHLVTLACEQVVTTVPEGAECDPEQLQKLLTCCRLMTPLLSRNVNANPIVEYVCTRVLPRFDSIVSPHSAEDAASNVAEPKATDKTVDLQLEVLKEFAEACTFAGKFEPARADELVSQVLTTLSCYLHAPTPEELETDTSRPVTETMGDLQLSHLECLLFALHQLGRFVNALNAQNAEPQENDAKTADAFRELQKRLQFAGSRVQQLRGKLNESLRTQTARKDNPEDKLKETALRMLNNIFALIRDLMRFPPLFKASVTLSWKPLPPPQAQPQVAAAAITKPSQAAPSNGSKPTSVPQTNASKRSAAAATIPVVSKQPRTTAPGFRPRPAPRPAPRPGAGSGNQGPRAGSYSTGRPGSGGRGGFRRGGFRGRRF